LLAISFNVNIVPEQRTCIVCQHNLINCFNWSLMTFNCFYLVINCQETAVVDF